MSKQQSNSYASVTTYKGLKGLRHRRSMYLGNTGLLDDRHAPRALNQTMQEVVSNSIDEFLGGYGDTIHITIHPDNAVTIKDNGRGMPKGPEESFTSVIESLTEPHSSGKFEGSGYDATGTAGMNGIGLKATNATSRYMTLHAISHSSTLPKGQDKPVLDGGREEYFIKVIQDEIVETKLINRWSADEIKEISSNEFEVNGQVYKTGTTITYLPDDGPTFDEDSNPVFESINWVNNDLFPRFDSSAFLNAKLTLHFVDEREELQPTIDEEGNEIQPATKYFEQVWVYERGVEEFVEKLSSSQTLLSKAKKPITFDDELSYDGYDFRMQASFVFTDDIDTNLKTFANGVPTKDGGPHLDGFKLGLTKAINSYAKANNLNKIKKKTLDAFKTEDVLEGLTGVFEIRIPAKIADFEGQTKEKLATAKAKPVVQQLTETHVTNWLHDNKDGAEQIISKIIESKVARDAAETARKEAKKARQKSGGAEQLLVLSKLKKATGKDPRKNELYIVEGDSASGGDRNTITQGMLPLRGKIKNVQNVSLTDALKNEEISTITAALGTGIGPAFNIEDLQYYKVIISCFTGDTKVKALDGNSYSFKELVDNNVEELWVYSQDQEGNMVPAKATKIRKTGTSKKLVKITLDNGEVVEATPDHYFLTVDGKYVQAQDLSIDDRLMALHTRIDEKGYEEFYDQNSESWVKTYRRVAETVNAEERRAAHSRLQIEIEQNNISLKQRNIQVHHADYNKLNNHPENLMWLTNIEHFSQYGNDWSHTYNGSEKHLEDVKRAHDAGKYSHTYFGQNGYNGSEKHVAAVKDAHARGTYENSYFGKNGWNGSEAQREVTRRNNATQKHIDSVKRGKILVAIKFLQLNNLPFDEYHYDFYRPVSSLRYKRITEMFESLEEAFEAAKSYEYHEYQHAGEFTYEYDVNKKHKTQIAKVIKKLIEDNVKFNEETYNSAKGVRTIAYQNITKYFDNYDVAYEYAENLNHRVTNIELVEFDKAQDVYCMNVDTYHNFLLDSGVIVKNCDSDNDGRHIQMLLTALFFKFYRPLIEKGHVFVTVPPLYKAVKYIKGEPHTKFFYDEHEMAEARQALIDDKYTITRFKGLGEMDDDEVTYALLDPSTRKIRRLTMEDVDATRQRLNILMGDNADLRKEWVENNVDYDKLYELL